jgi:hypothetical protein
MTDHPTIPIIGELVDNDEPRLSPEEQEGERRRARRAFEALDAAVDGLMAAVPESDRRAIIEGRTAYVIGESGIEVVADPYPPPSESKAPAE